LTILSSFTLNKNPIKAIGIVPINTGGTRLKNFLFDNFFVSSKSLIAAKSIAASDPTCIITIRRSRSVLILSNDSANTKCPEDETGRNSVNP